MQNKHAWAKSYINASIGFWIQPTQLIPNIRLINIKQQS